MPPAGLASCMHVSSKKQEKRNTSGNCNERWRLKAGAMTAVQVWGEKWSRSKGDSEPKWVNTKGVNLIVTANCGHWPSSVMITSWVVFPDLGTSPSALSLTERKTGIWILRLLTKQKADRWPVLRPSEAHRSGSWHMTGDEIFVQQCPGREYSWGWGVGRTAGIVWLISSLRQRWRCCWAVVSWRQTPSTLCLMVEGHHQQFSQEASFLAVLEDVFPGKESQGYACIVSTSQALPKSLTNPILRGEGKDR